MSNTDTTTVADQTGVARTADGTIADQGASTTTTTTTPEPKTTTPPGDGKTILNQTAAPKEGDTTKPDAKTEGAPEKYEDYKVPDGFTLDPEVKTKADGIFKGLGLSQDQAQSLVDFYRELTTEAAAEPYKAYQDMVDGWLQQAMEHPDLRGKIGEGKEVNVRIGKLLDSLPDQKLASDYREAMDLSGIGNHPAFIRVHDYLAKLLTEGTHVAGNGPSPGGQSRPGAAAQPGAAAALWPTLPPAGGTR